MTISVRLPPRVEQKLCRILRLAQVTRSEAVKQALDRLFETGARNLAVGLGADIFARHERVKPTRTSRATASACCASASGARRKLTRILADTGFLVALFHRTTGSPHSARSVPEQAPPSLARRFAPVIVDLLFLSGRKANC